MFEYVHSGILSEILFPGHPIKRKIWYIFKGLIIEHNPSTPPYYLEIISERLLVFRGSKVVLFEVQAESKYRITKCVP